MNNKCILKLGPTRWFDQELWGMRKRYKSKLLQDFCLSNWKMEFLLTEIKREWEGRFGEDIRS